MPGGELLEIFLTEAWDGLALLEGSVGDLRATDRNDDHELGQVSLIAHRLRGSAGLYGYPQLASLAASPNVSPSPARTSRRDHRLPIERLRLPRHTRG